MIKNDQQFDVVRKQLELAESALITIHREVRLQDPVLYNLMSEVYIETVLELREQLDAYLGIHTKRSFKCESMIENDEHFDFVRKQLGIAESALVNMHLEARPKAPRFYDLMSESYIDMLLELRDQCDAYLGIRTTATPQTTE